MAPAEMPAAEMCLLMPPSEQLHTEDGTQACRQSINHAAAEPRQSGIGQTSATRAANVKTRIDRIESELSRTREKRGDRKCKSSRNGRAPAAASSFRQAEALKQHHGSNLKKAAACDGVQAARGLAHVPNKWMPNQPCNRRDAKDGEESDSSSSSGNCIM